MHTFYQKKSNKPIMQGRIDTHIHQKAHVTLFETLDREKKFFFVFFFLSPFFYFKNERKADT